MISKCGMLRPQLAIQKKSVNSKTEAEAGAGAFVADNHGRTFNYTSRRITEESNGKENPPCGGYNR